MFLPHYLSKMMIISSEGKEEVRERISWSIKPWYRRGRESGPHLISREAGASM